MSAGRARRLSPALFVLLGSGLCATAARAADAADVARLVAEPALQALADWPAGQHRTPARARRASRPSGRRQAPGKPQRRPQRPGATAASPGQPHGSNQQEMPNASLRS